MSHKTCLAERLFPTLLRKKAKLKRDVLSLTVGWRGREWGASLLTLLMFHSPNPDPTKGAFEGCNVSPINSSNCYPASIPCDGPVDRWPIAAPSSYYKFSLPLHRSHTTGGGANARTVVCESRLCAFACRPWCAFRLSWKCLAQTHCTLLTDLLTALVGWREVGFYRIQARDDIKYYSPPVRFSSTTPHSCCAPLHTPCPTPEKVISIHRYHHPIGLISVSCINGDDDGKGFFATDLNEVHQMCDGEIFPPTSPTQTGACNKPNSMSAYHTQQGKRGGRKSALSIVLDVWCCFL